MNCTQRLGRVKSEIETIQRLQSMLDDAFMALELLNEVGVAHSPALCLTSWSRLNDERNVWFRRGRRMTSRFCRRHLLSQRAFSLGSTNGRLCASSVSPCAEEGSFMRGTGHTHAMPHQFHVYHSPPHSLCYLLRRWTSR
jgi:hypothetical protein